MLNNLIPNKELRLLVVSAIVLLFIYIVVVYLTRYRSVAPLRGALMGAFLHLRLALRLRRSYDSVSP